MAINKPQKKHWKKAKKGQRKRYVDPQTRKVWYNVRAPAPFETTSIGLTCVNRKVGTSILSFSSYPNFKETEESGLLGRVCDVSLADLNTNSE